MAQDLLIIDWIGQRRRWHQDLVLSHGPRNHATSMVWQIESRINQKLGGFAKSFLWKFCRYYYTPNHPRRVKRTQAERRWKSQKLLSMIWRTTSSSTRHHPTRSNWSFLSWNHGQVAILGLLQRKPEKQWRIQTHSRKDDYCRGEDTRKVPG